MQWFSALVVLLLSLAGPLWAETPPASQGRWFPPPGKPVAVALVIHGLNLKPERMDPLAQFLAAAGIETFRLSLSGHGSGAFKDVSASGWLTETRGGYDLVARRAEELHVPIFLVGYSLGGLLGELLLASVPASEPIRCKRVVLLAPAIAPQPITSLVKLLFFLGKGFTLPSADSPAYRAHSGTPMAAYEALFTLVDRLRAIGFRRLNLPTLVFVRKDDELVSLPRIRTTMRNYHLANWRLLVVPDNPTGHYAHHLIIDATTLGRREWHRMQQQLLGFLLPATQ